MWLESDDGRGRDILWRVGGWCLLPLVLSGPALLVAAPAAIGPAHLRFGLLWLIVTMAMFGAAGALSHRRRAWEDGLWMLVLLALAFATLKIAGEGGWARLDALLSGLSFGGQSIEPTLQSLLVRTLSLTAAGALLAVGAHDCAYRVREALEDFGILEPREEDAPQPARPQAARPRQQSGPQAQQRQATPPPPPNPADLREASACAALGLRSGASEREILRAYKALMKKAHPDRGGSTEAAARLNAARDFLLGKAR